MNESNEMSVPVSSIDSLHRMHSSPSSSTSSCDISSSIESKKVALFMCSNRTLLLIVCCSVRRENGTPLKFFRLNPVSMEVSIFNRTLLSRNVIYPYSWLEISIERDFQLNATFKSYLYALHKWRRRTDRVLYTSLLQLYLWHRLPISNNHSWNFRTIDYCSLNACFVRRSNLSQLCCDWRRH